LSGGGIESFENKIVYYGPEYLRRDKKAAVLNSRQSKYPVGNDLWIRATRKAVAYIKSRDATLVTSLGMNTWELTLVLASMIQSKVIVVIPDGGQQHINTVRDIQNRFQLNPEKTGFAIIKGEFKQSPKSFWPTRDFLIIALADQILPVAIRSGGNLEKLINKNKSKMVTDFSIPYRKTAHHRPRYDKCRPHPALEKGEFLVHFVRSTASPWPGESEYEYYRAVIESENNYCHSAQETLQRILQMKSINASSRNIRDGFRVVGFTELSPENLPDLFRYRPRLVNPNFEPYGIGLPKSLAVDLGIRPVIYGSPHIYSSLAESDRPYFQSEGGDGGRWLSEQEWRHKGDFRFAQIPERNMRVFVPDTTQVESISANTGIPVVPLLVR
jgi:hypothetical protein